MIVMYDITIIGAGIIGSLIAHRLSKYNLNVLLLEKDNDVCNGATCANSAMIHSGHDPKTGTLKCKYNVLGNRMYPDLCKELQVAYKQIGAFVVATSKDEEEKLEILIQNCIDRQIPYEVLDGESARKIEKNLSDTVTKVLSLPTTGIITPWEVTIAACEEAILNGVELKLNYEVKTIKKIESSYVINDEIKTKVIINCAGVHCDDITSMLRNSPYHIEAKKGEYYVLDHSREMLVNRIIYPTPSSKGKGVLAIPTIHGNILLGPNSDYCENKDDTSTGFGLDYVKNEINKTIKNIPFNTMIHNFAGLRPHIDLGDFYIREDDIMNGFIHVAGIESPGLTSAPAIAKDVVDDIVLPKFDVVEKQNYLKRKPFIKINELNDLQKNDLINNNHDFGKIICRCEKISLGEIKDVINRKCGATTIKGIKLRCRPGMGRCQGSFCESEIFKILQQELKTDTKSIKLNNNGSEIVSSFVKEDL